MKNLPKSTKIPMPEILFSHWLKVLTLAEFKVLCCLVYTSNSIQSDFLFSDSFITTISLHHIANDTHLSRKAVIQAIKKLCDLHIVTKYKHFQSKKLNGVNTYEIRLGEVKHGKPKISYMSKMMDRILNLKKLYENNDKLI